MFFSTTALFTEFNSSSHAESASADLNIKVAPVISLHIEKNGVSTNELNLSANPTASGTFVKDDITAKVSTNNETGYTLTFANNDTDTSMHHTDTTITTTIPSIAADTDEGSFPINSWAYALGSASSSSLTFSPIPTSTNATTIKSTTTPVLEDATNITFAAKVGTNITAGTYLDTVVFSATTNYVPNNLERISTMQQMTPQVCKQANIGDQATLTDTRDNKTYVVKKLADNKCWMVQNLALGGSQAITLTPADSNVTANFTLDPSSDSFGDTNDAAGININRMHDNGNTWLDPIVPGQNSAIHTTGTPASQTQYMGNYYNWYTATAGTGTYEMSTDGANATSSICPKGWRLPKGGAINTANGNGELQQLYDAYGNVADFLSATSATLSGDWYRQSAYDQGSYGLWWSSTVTHATNGYGLNFNSSDVSQQYGNYKRSGLSIRCVAEDDLTTISTMQQMTSSICANTATPAVTDTTVPQNTLKDVRDGNTYVVRKLADGNCWMSQNLNLALSTSAALDSTTSDLSPGRTWTPQNNTQTTAGTVWARDGGDVARSFEPGEAMYFDGGVGTGTLDTSTYNYSGYLSSGAAYWHVGNYYNWYAATAGTGLAATANNDVATTVSDSICPKGWKLPDNEGPKSFINLLFTTYGLADNDVTSADKLLAAPLNFVRSGYYHWSEARVRNRGHDGIWWSNTAYAALSAHHLGTNPSRVIPQSGGYKGYGLTVRCVAR